MYTREDYSAIKRDKTVSFAEMWTDLETVIRSQKDNINANMYNQKTGIEDFIYKAVKITQTHPALCDPKDYIIHGIFQARILE